MLTQNLRVSAIFYSVPQNQLHSLVMLRIVIKKRMVNEHWPLLATFSLFAE